MIVFLSSSSLIVLLVLPSIKISELLYFAVGLSVTSSKSLEHCYMVGKLITCKKNYPRILQKLTVKKVTLYLFFPQSKNSLVVMLVGKNSGRLFGCVVGCVGLGLLF